MKPRTPQPAAFVLLRAWLFTLLCGLLAGCENPRGDFHVVVPNAKDVATGSAVLWRGETVGHVSAVEPAGGGVRLVAVLDEKHRDRLRADLRAAPVKSKRTGGAPALEIYGGSNPKAPLITRGQRVGAGGLLARAGSWPGSREIAVLAAAVVLVVLFFALRGLLKLLSLLTAAALCALAFTFLRARWSDGGSAEFEARIAAMADEVIQSPAACEAWRRIQAGVFTWSQPSPAHLEEELDARGEELRRSGDAEAAGEIARLRGKLR